MTVYNKLVTTALKYTPVVLEHHVPYKNLPNGRLCVCCYYVIYFRASNSRSRRSKPPTQTPKLTTIQKLIQSYFHNVIHILDQLTDDDMIEVAVTESAKIVPWVISSRRAVKLYLKVRMSRCALHHGSLIRQKPPRCPRNAWSCGAVAVIASGSLHSSLSGS
jgi:nucleolar complex protein 2